MNKNIKLQVFEKYNGHCAYCGKEITVVNFQVDHIQPIYQLGSDNINNLNPSCRSCNHYKRSYSLGGFRNLMQTLHERLERIYIVRVALDYGIIKMKEFDGKFYFEKICETKK